MLVPRDTQGRRCGHDAQVLDKPYLFFIDIMKCVGPNVIFTGCKTPQVICVTTDGLLDYHSYTYV